MFSSKTNALFHFALAVYLLSNAAFAASWTSYDQQEGLPALSKGGARVLSSVFVLWEKTGPGPTSRRR